MGPHIVPKVVRLRDETEAIWVLLDQDVGVGAKRELQDPTENMGQAAELLVGEAQNGLSFGKWASRVVLDGDVAPLGNRVDLHGFGFGFNGGGEQDGER